MQCHGSCRTRAMPSATFLLQVAWWSSQDNSGLLKMPKAFLAIAFFACLTASVTCLVGSMLVSPHRTVGRTTMLRKRILMVAGIRQRMRSSGTRWMAPRPTCTRSGSPSLALAQAQFSWLPNSAAISEGLVHALEHASEHHN